MVEIVVTATGLITAAGCGAQRVLAAMDAGHTFLSTGQDNGVDGLWPLAALDPEDVRWPEDDPWWDDNLKFANFSTRMAVAATRETMRAAGSFADTDPERGGVVMAIAGGDDESKFMPALLARAAEDPRPLATMLYDEVPDYTYLKGIMSQTGQFVAKATGFRGSNLALYREATAGGFGALSFAANLIIEGELDRVLVIGASPPLSAQAACAIDGMDPFGSCASAGTGPFDVGRNGPSIGVSAVGLLIESETAALARGATVQAWLIGCETLSAESSEEALAAAARRLTGSGDPATYLWWAHGAASQTADRQECAAVDSIRLGPVTCSKGTIGNALECSALIDVALAAEALNRRSLPPIGLLRTPDPHLGNHDWVMDSPRPLAGGEQMLVTALGTSRSCCGGAALIAEFVR